MLMIYKVLALLRKFSHSVNMENRYTPSSYQGLTTAPQNNSQGIIRALLLKNKSRHRED